MSSRESLIRALASLDRRHESIDDDAAGILEGLDIMKKCVEIEREAKKVSATSDALLLFKSPQALAELKKLRDEGGPEELLEYRKLIDELDAALIAALDARMAVSKAIAHAKRGMDKQIYDKKREDVVLARACEAGDHDYTDIFFEIMITSKTIQTSE